ncbi:sodium:calcium antiporter [Wenxinia marina]|uniref:Ca2+/Na+ antiporter n=1 Tax=Wenxinia marina DSM 24838 TaxID=1123501 RepID=A0A0D0PYB4_9RHOB|nr:sodium:calcium antiporter [Wenxinia marina]KIQ67419.1 Ca2+/Na+ antiporter [Wenxinia marina DSM 24838]GGL69629.1 hypothetical protein GCM10011392_25170 [Wenxinia marina]
MPSFADWPIWGNVALFCVAAAAVWMSGTRLSRYADAIAKRTGIGQAVLGVILLGGITSLPEIAVTGTAATGGNAQLAVNNLLGGFTAQVAVLALADAVIRKRALTAVVPDPIVLLQGALGIVLVSITVCGIVVGDVAVLGAGAWTWGILFVFLYAIRMVAKSGSHPAWQVVGEPPSEEIGAEQPEVDHSDRRLYMLTAGVAAVILAMGWLLSTTGEALAEQTGLGDSFFGAVFIAISTSLPEISTVIAAVRLGRYVMAVSDIFGTNLFDVAIIVVVDLLFPGGPVLAEVGSFSILAGILGILVTAIYLAGLIERRDPAVAGVGLDTILVAGVYVGGVVLLYTLR